MRKLTFLAVVCAAVPGCSSSAETTGHKPAQAPETDEPDEPVDTSTEVVDPEGPPPVNVLMITMDTTRRDRLNSNGYTDRITSPNIDALLGSGLALRNHFSCSTWTYASFVCFLTGRDQVTLGWVPSNIQGGNRDPYPSDDLPSLARILNDEGFATGLVWSNSFIGPSKNMDQGHETEEQGGVADSLGTMALARMDLLVEDGRPWFLHAHFNDPHGMYNPPEEYLAGYDDLPPCLAFDLTERDQFEQMGVSWPLMSPEDKEACLARLALRYDASIRFADDWIGLLLDNLDNHGLRDETLIVYGTDHGEEFGEHALFEHGKGPFAEINASTVGLSYPPRIEPEEFWGLSSHDDVLPTILNVMDIPIPDGGTGVVLGVEEREVAHALVYKRQDTWQAVISPTDKLIYHWEGDKYYFDNSIDPADLSNLYDPALPRVVELWGELQPKVDEFEAFIDDAVPIDPGL